VEQDPDPDPDPGFFQESDLNTDLDPVQNSLGRQHCLKIKKRSNTLNKNCRIILFFSSSDFLYIPALKRVEINMYSTLSVITESEIHLIMRRIIRLNFTGLFKMHSVSSTYFTAIFFWAQDMCKYFTETFCTSGGCKSVSRLYERPLNSLLLRIFQHAYF
jgi:hypothetical protein